MSNIDVRGNIVDEKVAHDSVQYSSTGPNLVVFSPLTYPAVLHRSSCDVLYTIGKQKQNKGDEDLG